MDSNRSKFSSKYDRVMPRLFNKSEQNLKKSNIVTRHDIASSHGKSSKKSGSDASCSAKSDLPIVLNNYEPDECVEKVPRRSYVVKPRRTLKSLDPPDTILAQRLFAEKPQDKKIAKTPRSAPMLSKMVGKNTEVLKRRIVSETKLRDLKDEIKSFDDSAKLSNIRSKLFQSCGVLLDEYGRVSIDKGVQVAEDRVVSPKSARLVHHTRFIQRRRLVPHSQLACGVLRRVVLGIERFNTTTKNINAAYQKSLFFCVRLRQISM